MTPAIADEILNCFSHRNKSLDDRLKFTKVKKAMQKLVFCFLIKNIPTTAQKWWLKVVNSGWQHLNLHSTFDYSTLQPVSHMPGSYKALKSLKMEDICNSSSKYRIFKEVFRMGTGKKELASKRKPKPPVKLVSCRIHTNCQQEREQEMWKLQLLKHTSFTDSTLLQKRLSNRCFTRFSL